MEIFLARSLEEHLGRCVSEREYSILYGTSLTSSDGTFIGLMCAFAKENCFESSENLRHFLDTNSMICPIGLHAIGLVDFNKSALGNPYDLRLKYIKLLHSVCESQDQQIARVILVAEEDPLSTSRGSRGRRQFKGSGWRPSADRNLENASIITKNFDAIHKNLCYFRLNAVIESALTPTSSRHGLAKALEQKLQDLQVDNRNDFAYGLNGDNSVILLPTTPATVVANADLGTITAAISVKDYLTALSKRRDKTAEMKKPEGDGAGSLSDVTQGLLPDFVVEINLFSNATDTRSIHGSSPLLTIGEGSTQIVRLYLDCFIVCSKTQSMADLLEIVEIAKRKQFSSILHFIRRWALSFSKPEELQVPIPFHIVNGPNLLTFYTAPTDSALDEFLDEIYSRFGYSDELPVFRKECSIRNRLFLSKRNILDIGDKLVAAPYSKFLKENAEWELTKVSGSYTYHHYKQDRFDDDGWGCAYRSLQTLFSWFKLQGLTNSPIPNHEQIQRILVDIKDREKSLIGSKQWIGAMEISRTLEQLLGIQCRIVNVPAGRDLGTAFATLKSHFETEGTPVMIGGGVYAYTIGGVAVNRTTGEVKALVIDPHYVGDDNVDLIFRKNGVAWRTPEFWDQNAFYNLCCPLRPRLNSPTSA